MHLRIIVSAIALVFASSAMAGPNWTYVDLGFVVSSSSDKDNAYTGLDLAGSFELGELWHLQAAVAYTEADIPTGSALKVTSELTSYELRAGVHPEITDNIDVVLDLGYSVADSKTNSSSAGPSVSNNPWYVDIRLGTRAMITPKFEMNAFLAFASGNDDCNACVPEKVDFTVVIPSIGAQYFFTDAFSLSVDYAFSTAETAYLDDGTDLSTDLQGDSAKLGVRWNF
jgi:opacity protein-like surface antigen